MISIHEDENTGDYFREYGFINDYVVRVFPSPDDMFRDDVRLEYWLSYALPGRNYPAIRPLSQLELRNLGRYLGGTFPPGRVRPGRALFDLLYNVGSMRSGVAD